MYGLFNIPASAKALEKKEYKNYMCTLCDSLHGDYGIKGRLLTNYDSTTLALLIGALDGSFHTEISRSPNFLCLHPLMHKKSPANFRFVSAVSIMIAYSRVLDESIENGKKMPQWILKSSDLASNYLSRYELDKSFFENELREQHRLEKEKNDLETLSVPSSEIISRIFGAIGELTGKTRYSQDLKKLGSELGKLIYVYDGLLDFQKDSNEGIFNCISACYFRQDKDIHRVSVEIFDFIQTTRNTISSILDKITFKHNDNLVRGIFLQDFEIRETGHQQNISGKLKGFYSSCSGTVNRMTFSKETIFDIITGKLQLRSIQDERAQADNSPCCYIICGCIFCLYLIDENSKKEHEKAKKEQLRKEEEERLAQKRLDEDLKKRRIKDEKRQKEEAERQEAKENLELLETSYEKAISLSLEVPDISDIQKAYKSKEYNETTNNSKELTEKLEVLINNAVPSISSELKNPVFKVGAGKKLQVELRNTGKTAAKNISAELSGNQLWEIKKIDVKVLSGIELLKPDEKGNINIWIKSDIEGEIPVVFTFKYTDGLNREYAEEKEFWLNSGEIGDIPLSPTIPAPKSSTTSMFPTELETLYTNPKFIGKGGFARVFQAKRKDDKVVAVKIPITLDEVTGRSFLREITSWHKLVHNNIVSIYDTNILPIPYLELEYVDGGSVGDMKKPLGIIQACNIIYEISEGLKYAHSKGILHRDLKPNNILLTKELVPKITDWGLSKIMAESKMTTITAFSPTYAAPEQISPKLFGKTDVRTDIYQVGIIFYELVTGKPPFAGDSLIEISSAIVNDIPELPSCLNPEAKQVDNIILKCIEKNLSQRYQSVEELQNAIDEIRKGVAPSMSVDLKNPNFKVGDGKKVQIKIRNTGLAAANNIIAELSGHQMWDSQNISVKVMSKIELLQPGENNVIDIWIKSDIGGEIPVKFTLKYTDILNREYQEEKEFRMKFSEITEKPVSPSDLGPRPSTTSTFPIELNKLYSNPSFIGKGGFARVFRAKRKDGKLVAVKIPLTLDEATGRSFLREITSWNKLVHNNIVSLYDANILPIPYLELEYVDGGSIGDMKKPLEIVQACKIIFDIAEGLKYAHNQGILHRDLKPNNIMLTGELVPKITDWGLSKIMAESKSTSIMAFTPVYAAPEQVSPKKFGKTDVRTDIYQAGTVFYELVTGKPPFGGESLIEISNSIVKDIPELPSSINPEAKPVDTIIIRCIQKDPSKRYQSAEELQKALAQYLKQECKRSFKESSEKNEITRSRFFCADLVMFSAKLKDYTEVMKYLMILMDYAKEKEKTEIENLKNELEFKLKEKIAIGEDFVDRIRVLAYRVLMK